MAQARGEISWHEFPVADDRLKRERQERLEKALRVNLERRKAQARGRRDSDKTSESDADPPQDGEKA